VTLELQLVLAHLPSSRQLAKSPGCASLLRRLSLLPGYRINWIASYSCTEMKTMRCWFLMLLRRLPTSTHVSTPSSTRSCGNLSASHSSRSDERVYDDCFCCISDISRGFSPTGDFLVAKKKLFLCYHFHFADRKIFKGTNVISGTLYTVFVAI